MQRCTDSTGDTEWLLLLTFYTKNTVKHNLFFSPYIHNTHLILGVMNFYLSDYWVGGRGGRVGGV